MQMFFKNYSVAAQLLLNFIRATVSNFHTIKFSRTFESWIHCFAKTWGRRSIIGVVRSGLGGGLSCEPHKLHCKGHRVPNAENVEEPFHQYGRHRKRQAEIDREHKAQIQKETGDIIEEKEDHHHEQAQARNASDEENYLQQDTAKATVFLVPEVAEPRVAIQGHRCQDKQN